MTTSPPPAPPPGPDDDRDAQVAAWLAVEPLDATTRSRLVAAALAGADADATGDVGGAPDGLADAVVSPLPATPRRRAPYATLVSVAAAVLAGLVLAGALLLPADDDPSPAAKGASVTSPAEASREAGDATALAPGPAADATAEAPVNGSFPGVTLPSIGDLGDVSTQAKLARAARAALSVPSGSATTTLTGCAASAGDAFGTPVAIGTGRIDGRKATVVVSEQAAGTTAVVAVRGRACGRAVSVTLP